MTKILNKYSKESCISKEYYKLKRTNFKYLTEYLDLDVT